MELQKKNNPLGRITDVLRTPLPLASSELPVEPIGTSGAWCAAGRGSAAIGTAALHGLCGGPALLSYESGEARGCDTSQRCGHPQVVSVIF